MFIHCTIFFVESCTTQTVLIIVSVKDEGISTSNL